jgi:hypothetical protein
VLQDGGSDRSTSAVYRLSENGVLQHFKKVIFVSSPQDLYVPEYSARVQVKLLSVRHFYEYSPIFPFVSL